MMDIQTGFNIALALVAFFGGMWVKNLSDAMADLKMTDKELAKEVHEIKTLVAGQYATRNELQALALSSKDDIKNLTEALFGKLDRIESKLDSKADK
jgi:hypothetical protein